MFLKGKRGKKGGVALYIKNVCTCPEVQKEVRGKPVESLCVKIKEGQGHGRGLLKSTKSGGGGR